MNRQDALEKAKHYSKVYHSICVDAEGFWAAVIEALSQEPICDRDCEHCTWTECPIEPCEDAVSRDAVCEIISDIRDCISVEGYWAIVERLKKLPSVAQKSETVTEFADRCRECGARYGKLLKQKTGHWISHYDEDAKEGWYECDRCHTERAFNTDYCPNCGAKMVEPQEREDKE